MNAGSSQAGGPSRLYSNMNGSLRTDDEIRAEFERIYAALQRGSHLWAGGGFTAAGFEAEGFRTEMAIRASAYFEAEVNSHVQRLLAGHNDHAPYSMLPAANNVRLPDASNLVTIHQARWSANPNNYPRPSPHLEFLNLDPDTQRARWIRMFRDAHPECSVETISQNIGSVYRLMEIWMIRRKWTMVTETYNHNVIGEVASAIVSGVSGWVLERMKTTARRELHLWRFTYVYKDARLWKPEEVSISRRLGILSIRPPSAASAHAPNGSGAGQEQQHRRQLEEMARDRILEWLEML